MKKVFAILPLFLLCTRGFSQSVAISNDGSGPHPSAMLDVKSSTKGLLVPRTSTTTRNLIPGTKGLLVYDTTVSKFYYHTGATWLEISTGTATNFWSTFGVNIYNNNTGNVGIGMLPPFKFSVDGDVYFTGDPPTIRFAGGTSSSFPKMLWSYTDNYVDYTITHVADRFVVGRAGGYLGFYSDLVVDTGGYVGIGSFSPKTKLHIEGGTDVGNGSGGYLQLGSSTSANIGIDNNEIQARNDGEVSRLVLQNGGGGVQIGSAVVPTGYALSIDGKVICEELKVKLSSSGWPDYVFSKTYKRLPLDEVEKYIAAHNRLPGIPSARQVKAEGLKVGEMQKNMMEKIEELTLYVIELKKEIEALKKAKQAL